MSEHTQPRYPSWMVQLVGLAALAAIVIVPNAGCRMLAVMFGERETKTVSAEWPHLVDKKICVLVRTDWEILFEYPQAPLEVAEHVQLALEEHVSGVKVVEPRKVTSYQTRNSDWDQQDPAEIGEHFRADRVVEITLTQYTTRDPENPHLHRGHMAAAVNVFNVEYPGSQPAFDSEVRTKYPTDSSGAWGVSERSIRRATLETFAQDVAGLFYDRQVRVN